MTDTSERAITVNDLPATSRPGPSSNELSELTEAQDRSLTVEPTLRGPPERTGNQGVVDPVRYLRLMPTSRRRARHRRWIILGFGVLPFCVTVLFTCFVATPMFSTETRFAIRGGVPAQIGVGALVGGDDSSAATADAVGAFIDGYAVNDFIKSRAALQKLLAKIDFVALASRPDADPFVRMSNHPTEAQLFATYIAMVKVDFNLYEQIISLRCYGFAPQDSVTLCKAVIQVAEEFANDMNLRARTDVLKIAEAGVKDAEQRSLDARLAVNRWREVRSDIDPTVDALMLSNLVNQLETQRLTAESQLEQLKKTSPRSPVRVVMERQIGALREQIKQQRARLGTKGASDTTAGNIKTYEVLKGEQDFADGNLTALRQTREQARIAMLRQQRFVALVAEPETNENPSYPDRTTLLPISLVAGLGLAFIGSMLVSTIRRSLLA